MAYTTVDNPGLFFNTKLWTGNDGSGHAITGVGFQPDFVWIKNRNTTDDHNLFDSVRGNTKTILSNSNAAEATNTSRLESFDSDGITVGADNDTNRNGDSIVGWNWLAGGTAPAITYTVKVVSDSGNKYRFDDFGTSAVTLDLQEGGTYTFDLSDSSNDGHPMKFSETSNGSHGGGSTYSTGVVYQLDGASVTEANYYNTSNFNSASSRKIIITVAASAPTLYYFCHYHSGMGGQANTNSSFGSSNFSGSIQSTVSASTTAGFSIVSYAGNNTAGATVGHRLSQEPKVMIFKNRDNGSTSWSFYHSAKGTSGTGRLNTTDAFGDTAFITTTPSSSVFTLTATTIVNENNMIAYCFAEKKGYSKFGSYTGNGNADGTFVYTGFKPALVITKANASSRNWVILDNKRLGYNDKNYRLFPNLSNAEDTTSGIVDITSNGFKFRSSNNSVNESGVTYIYMAFAESPFVNSNGVPTNAR